MLTMHVPATMLTARAHLRMLTSQQPRARVQMGAARLQNKSQRCQRLFVCKAAKEDDASALKQKAAADKAAEAGSLAKGAAERAQLLAKERAAAAAAAPKPVSKPKPAAPKPVEKPTELSPPEPVGPELNYFILIGGFLAIIIAFYGFVAIFSGVFVEVFFPMIFGPRDN